MPKSIECAHRKYEKVNTVHTKNKPDLQNTRIQSSLLDKWNVAKVSGESRIIFLPERSSICQYPRKISAISVNKQSRTGLLLAHPVSYILKIQKKDGTFWKPPSHNQPKSVRL